MLSIELCWVTHGHEQIEFFMIQTKIHLSISHIVSKQNNYNARSWMESTIPVWYSHYTRGVTRMPCELSVPLRPDKSETEVKVMLLYTDQ